MAAEHARTNDSTDTDRGNTPPYWGLSKILWELPADTPIDELPQAIEEYREEHDV